MSPTALDETLGASSPDEPEEALEPGVVLADRYRIGRRLGRGGMGTVYLAEHVRVGRAVAVKVLGSDWLGHAEIARRFREEARAASAVGHPNIIEVFDAGELPDGRPYLVMEYLEGADLFTVVERRGALPLDEGCRIMVAVARAIGAAHARGVIHRDLKSENVMVVERAGSRAVKVLDFGIAALRNVEGRPSTEVGRVMGTPAYMAPEQAAGARVEAAVDVYALGVLLHEVLTGVLPFASLGPEGMLLAKVSSPAPSVASVRGDLPAELVMLVDQCLAREPHQRPASADAVAERLEGWLERRSVGAVSLGATGVAPTRIVPLEEEVPASSGGLRWRWSIPAAALVLVSTGGAYWLGVEGSSEPRSIVAPSEPSAVVVAPPGPSRDGSAPGIEEDRDAASSGAEASAVLVSDGSGEAPTGVGAGTTTGE
ncbi:MAG: serine/threonine protein kinase, partial [Myxococcales bacterium]|nr:serine/threonine protein kinase [Myxococcales bacterium]